MFRIALVIFILIIGYDAVAHQGAYTRQAWDALVQLTGSAVDGAKGLGERARDEASPPRN